MPQRIFRIEGNVISLQGTGVPNLRVEAWDKDLLLDDFLGSAITDAGGAFLIEFSEDRFREFFLDRTPDVFFVVYSETTKLADTRNTLVCNIGEETANVTLKVDVPAGETPAEDKDEFIVKGLVTGFEDNATGQVLVKVSDVRHKQQKLLVVAYTDSDNRYEAHWHSEQLLEPNKGYANLKAELFDSVAKTLSLGESEVIFKAPRVLELNVAITRTYSEYERYTAIVREANKGDALSSLKDEDIPFISDETGIESQFIEYLITASILGKKTEQPAAFFYGLVRQGLPPNLSDLLDTESESLNKALAAAFDQNIIPSDLRDVSGSFTEKLKQLAGVDHGINTKRQKEKLKQIGKIIDLDDSKLEAVLKRASSPQTLNDHTLKSLVEDGELEEKDAKELGLITSLNNLFDGNITLATSVKKGTFDKLPEGKLGRMDELVAFEKNDWLEILKESEVTPPQDLTQDAHAELITKTVEYLFSSKALLARMMSKETSEIGNDLETLKPLFDRNERIFSVDRFVRLDQGDLDEDAIEKLHTAHTKLKRFANTYPGLRIKEILDDVQLSASEKQSQIHKRLHLLKRFEKTNANVEFLNLDYVPDSPDMESLDFTGVSAEERRMVLDNLKAYQRVHAVARDVSTSNKILEAGLHSPFSMTNGGYTEFKLATGQNDHEAKPNFGRALELTGKGYLAAFGLGEAANGPFGQMAVDNPSQDAADYLRKIDGWESLFGNLDFCHCPHCRSVLSPAAYFVDLMYFVEKNCFFHIPDGSAGFRAKEDDPLHLRNRRPDLWKLPLTCENTNTRMPYLDIINEVLENYIAVEALENEADLPEVGADRSDIEDIVYRELSTSMRSFQQPFCLPLERLTIYLEHFDISRGYIAKLLAEPGDDSDEVVAAAVLNIPRSPAAPEYELITEVSSISSDDTDPIYGLRFEEDPEDSEKLTYYDPNLDPNADDYEEEKDQSRKDVQVLLKAIGLKRAELGKLITTDFVRVGSVEDNGSPSSESLEIISDKRISSGPDKSVQDDIERIHGLSSVSLDRMHRFIRLWRHLPWTIRELDLVLSHLAKAGFPAGINSTTVKYLASILIIQERFHISVEESCTLWSELPTRTTGDDRESLFNRLFNLPDFVRSGGVWDEKVDEQFLHPAFRSTPPEPDEIDNTLHRLLAGIRLDDEALLQLITNLLVPCELRIETAPDSDAADKLILAFEFEFEFETEWQNCAVLIVGEENEPNKWTIAGYSDTGEFNTVVINDPTHGLAKELQKDPVDESKVLRIAATNLDRTLYFELTLGTLSLLYRHARLAEGLNLSVPKLFQLIRLADLGSSSFVDNLDDLLSVLEFYDWWQASGYTLDEVELLTSTLANDGASPEAQEITKRILAAIKADQALMFSDTVFTFLEGVTEEHSKRIVAANTGAIVEVLGAGYRVARIFGPAVQIHIPEGIAVDEQDIRDLLSEYATIDAPDFTSALFTELPGVTVAQSHALIEANSAMRSPLGVIDKAPGIRYQIAKGVNLSNLPELSIPSELGLTATVDESEIQTIFATYAKDSYPVFDDDLFTKIEGISKVQSQEIIAANRVVAVDGSHLDLIVPVPLDNTFWLTGTRDSEQQLIIPNEVPITQADLKALLQTYHASAVITQYLSAALGISREKTETLISLALGIDDLADMDPSFTTALQENDPDGRLSTLCRTLLRLSTLFKSDSYDPDAIDFVRNHSGDAADVFGALPFLSDMVPVTIEDLRLLSIYREFLEVTENDESRERLHTVLYSFNSGTGAFYDNSVDPAERERIQEALSQVLGTEVGIAITAHEEIELPASALIALKKLTRCVNVAKQLGVGSETLALIVSNEFPNLDQAADAILAAFRAKYEDETVWQEKIRPFEDRIRSRKRDALTDYLINSLDPKIFQTTNDLYHHFLLDTELEGCATTSRVVAATNSVQLYVHRIRMNLEQNEAESIRVELDIFADAEWEWRKNYRVWEANRKVFLFPENYLEPDLRDNKTPLFKELEATLLQQEINENTAQEAYTKYLRGFEELATLKIAGSFHEKDGDRDVLHLFGVTRSEEIIYYYRSVENMYRSAHKDTEETCGVVWNPWRKIDVAIPVRNVAPIVYNKRLYVFWVDINTQPKNSSFNRGSSSFMGYRHRMSLKYTTYKSDGSWAVTQEIKLGTAPFEIDDGIIIDYLWPGEWKVRNGVSVYTMTPRYGSDDDVHFGKTKEEKVLQKIGEARDADPDEFLTNRDRWLLTMQFSDFDAKDSYTLRGFQWDQVYPYVNNNGDLVITGRDLIMRSRVDFLNNKIGPRTLEKQSGFPGENQQFPAWRFLSSDGREIRYGEPYQYTHSELPGPRVYIDPYAHASVVLLDSRLDQYEYFPFPDSYNQQTVLLLNASTTLAVVNGTLSDAVADLDGDVFYLQSDPSGGETYFIKRIGTTVSDGLIQKLFSEGVRNLLSTATQRTELKEKDPAITIENGWVGEDVTGSDIVHFDGSYGVYFRELFLHIPFLIANHLNSQQEFTLAQEWYHFIFNPTAKSENHDSISEDRNWRYFEFRQEYRDLKEEGPMPSLREQLQDTTSIEEYKRDPFSPHAIARCPLRFSAYQKATVMKYIDNLLDWGDDLFAQDTMESINEATLLYILASDILGERPAELGVCTQSEDVPNTYEQIAPELTEDNEFLIEISHQVRSTRTEEPKGLKQKVLPPGALAAAKENVIKKLKGGLAKGKAEGDGSNSFPLTLVFCFPENKDLIAYWDRVEDKLFKIRNCMNISGARRELSLFAPEINPMLLVRAKAAGLSLDDVLNSINGDLPPYRFSYVIEKAKAYAATLQGFGAALLGALEKRDVEELNQLRAGQQQNILKMTSQIKQREIDAAAASYEVLQKREETVTYRTQYYSGLIDEYMSAAESLQLTSRKDASERRKVAHGFDLLAAFSYLVAQLGAITALKYGGKEIGDSLSSIAAAIHAKANILNEEAAMAGLNAGFERRKQGWEYQREIAAHELTEIEKQKAVAEIRLAVAEELKAIHETAVEQQQEIYDLYRDKFTNLGLYTWLSTALQRLYREAYNNAYAMAKLAEQAYRFERGDDAAELIGHGHWVASKAGLLAGEGLLIDLQNLERRYLETNYRGLEVDQSFSLTQVAPDALIQLKETGVCTFEVSEIFFNLFYPGHYRRRIKAVRLTIPCITGPYTNVSATLTLTSSQLRKEPKLGEPYLLDVPRSRSLTIATSTAQNDAGVFELNFRDERYMPFEGAGAVSTWELRLPKNFKQFDYQTINDVILHISYTAEQDAALRDAVEGQNETIEGAIRSFLTNLDNPPLSRVFSFRQEFSNEFNRLLHSAAGTQATVEFEISDKHFPVFLKGEHLAIDDAVLILRTDIDELGELSMTLNGTEAPLDRGDGWGGLPYANITTAFEGEQGMIHRHVLSVPNAGSLAPAAEAPESHPDTSTIDPDKLQDIYLYVAYRLTASTG